MTMCSSTYRLFHLFSPPFHLFFVSRNKCQGQKSLCDSFHLLEEKNFVNSLNDVLRWIFYFTVSQYTVNKNKSIKSIKKLDINDQNYKTTILYQPCDF